MLLSIHNFLVPHFLLHLSSFVNDKFKISRTVLSSSFANFILFENNVRTNFISRFITKRREAKTTYRHLYKITIENVKHHNRAKSQSFRSYRSRCISLSAISMLPSATVSMTSPDMLDMNAIPSAILKRTHILQRTYFEHVRASLLLLDTTLHPLLRALKSLNNMMCPGCHSDLKRQDSYHRVCHYWMYFYRMRHNL